MRSGTWETSQSAKDQTAWLAVTDAPWSKTLVSGNNDDAAVKDCDGWESVQPYAELSVDGSQVVLCHYPFRTWRNSGKGWANLHGHSHGA